ncbi:MAG: hypothetical protein KDC92_06385, partial [Bacteroidetes bacterium]|nr:hypothetical protein [Bacteroidota bacterium]
MKKIILSILAIAAIAVSIFIIKSPNNIGSVGDTGIGSKHDPHARLNWEKQRLQDPETGEIPENILAEEMAYAQTLPVNSKSFKTGAWKQRGPYNIGGRTRALAMDVRNPEVLLTGGVSGGVYRSENGGESWTQVTGSDHLKSVTHIIQD